MDLIPDETKPVVMVQPAPDLQRALDDDFERLWVDPPEPIVVTDVRRRMMLNSVRDHQVASRDREDFDLDHWDPALQNSMTSRQRRLRAQRLIEKSREIEKSRGRVA